MLITNIKFFEIRITKNVLITNFIISILNNNKSFILLFLLNIYIIIKVNILAKTRIIINYLILLFLLNTYIIAKASILIKIIKLII